LAAIPADRAEAEQARTLRLRNHTPLLGSRARPLPL